MNWYQAGTAIAKKGRFGMPTTRRSVFYWADGRFAYAISCEIAKTDLLRVVNLVYQQLNPWVTRDQEPRGLVHDRRKISGSRVYADVILRRVESQVIECR